MRNRPITSGQSRQADYLRARADFALGRVEDGRGGWGPVAITPFPTLAHRTGRADFRHPALRPASSQGSRHGNSGQAFETQQAAFSMDNVEGEPPCAAPCHLMPPGEEVSNALINIVVDSTESRSPRSETEVVRPTKECPVQCVAHPTDRCCRAPAVDQPSS